MKKRYLLALLPVLALTSCGPTYLEGTYKFMMGKDGQIETQIGLEVDLTNEQFLCYTYDDIYDEVKTDADLTTTYISSVPEGKIIKCVKDTRVHESDPDFTKFKEVIGYCYSFYQKEGNGLTYKGINRPTKGEPVDLVPSGKKFNARLRIGHQMATLPDEILFGLTMGFSGYYKDPEPDYFDPTFGKRYEIGFVFNQNSILGIEWLYNFVSNQYNSTFTKIIRDVIDMIPLPTEAEDYSSYLVTTFCDNKTLTLKIPVSINDLLLQLTWYGIYIDIDSDMKRKISALDIEDILNNKEEFLGAIKFKDLTTIDDPRSGATGKLPLPGPEVRFGVNPNLDQCIEMNYHYAPYFSNTYTFSEAGRQHKTGVISAHANEQSGEMFYYYKTYKTKPSTEISPSFDPEFETYGGDKLTTKLRTKKVFGIFTDYTDVDIVFEDGSKNDSFCGRQIQHVYQKDTTVELKPEEYYVEPFLFKDFHILPLTLTKN